MSATLVSAQSGQTTRRPSAPAASTARPQQQGSQAPAATNAPAAAADVATQRALIDQYCVGCHNQRAKTANLMLDQLDLAHLGQHAEIAEKVVRKLRAGMMPPTNQKRP